MWRLSAPFWAWALASTLLGLGFTFFSGAVEAWLVDALTATGFYRTARLRLCERRDRRGRGDADRLRRRWLHRSNHQPRCSVHGQDCRPGADVRVRVHAHARHRLYAEGREQPVARDQESARGLDPLRPSQSAGAMGDAGQHLRGRRVDIRLLCDAAVPAAVVWRSERCTVSPGSQPRSSAARRLEEASWCRVFVVASIVERRYS